VIGWNPVALQLRYLQALADIAAERNFTTIFPSAIDTISPLSEKADPEGDVAIGPIPNSHPTHLQQGCPTLSQIFSLEHVNSTVFSS
jgi:hypothetical protein